MWFFLVVTFSAEKDKTIQKEDRSATGMFQCCVFPDHNKQAGCEVNNGSQPQQSRRFHKISSEDEEEGLVRITIPVSCGCLPSSQTFFPWFTPLQMSCFIFLPVSVSGIICIYYQLFIPLAFPHQVFPLATNLSVSTLRSERLWCEERENEKREVKRERGERNTEWGRNEGPRRVGMQGGAEGRMVGRGGGGVRICAGLIYSSEGGET